MSFVRHRGVSCEPLGGLGVLGSRSVGCRSPTVWLPCSFPCPPVAFSGSDTPSQLFSQLHQGDCVGRCGGRSPRERSSRTSSFGSGLLQPPLCHPQGLRWLEACDRSRTPQPVGPCLPVSCGDSFVGSPISSSGGLDGIPGSPGCLPSGSGAPVISALPEVLRGGLSPAVSRSLFRPLDCPSGVHAGHGPCLCHHAPLRLQDPALSGRMACPRVLVSGDSAGEGFSTLALPGARSMCEPLQELSGPGSDFGLSGDETSNRSFEGFPDPKACPEALLSAARIRILPSAAAVSVATTSGCNVVPLFHHTRVSTANAFTSAAPQHHRPSSSRFSVGVLGRFLPRGSSVVVRRIPSVRRASAGSSAAGFRPLHRRLGFGRLPSGRPSVQLVASVLFDVFNQPPGNPCGVLQSSGFSSSPSRSFRVPLCGQYDRSVVFPEAGRDSLCYPELCCPIDSSSLRTPSDPLGSAIHSGQTECCSRLSQSPLPGPRLGVDLVSSSFPGASSSVACDHRPLRDLDECSSSGVPPSNGGSSVSGHGRHDAVLGWLAGVCLPTLQLTASCPVECSAVQGSGAHSTGSLLASAPLVSRPSGASGGCPSVPSTAEGSTQMAALPLLSPEPPLASADCLSYFERSARAFGFTSTVARQLARCRRASTRVNYQAKWSIFRARCHRLGHSVSRPTLPKIASFLLYLRRSLSLSYSCIASYCSMLSSVFRFVLPDLASHFVLRDLLRSFRLERPLSSSRVPPWDLSLVLSFLRGAPFEPLRALFGIFLARCSSLLLWLRRVE